MKISSEALIDYLSCPMKYHYRYVEQLDPLGPDPKNPTDNALEKVFDRELHRIAYHLFNYIQDGRYPSEYLLRKKWGNVWVKSRTMDELMDGTKRIKKPEENFRRYLERLGTDVVGKLHRDFKDDYGIPLLVGKKAVANIEGHEVEVTIDLIREHEGKLELVEFNTGMNTKARQSNQARPIQLHVDHDLHTTLSVLAFEQLTGEKVERVVYYDFLADRMIDTQRNAQDFENAARIIDQVAKALDAGINYPVMNNHCQNCPFQDRCRTGDWYKE